MFKLRKNFFFQYTETMDNRKTRPAIIHAEFVIIDFCSWSNKIKQSINLLFAT